MKLYSFIKLCCLGLVAAGLALPVGAVAQEKKEKPAKANKAAAKKTEAKQSKLRHVVAFKFKEGTSKEKIEEVLVAFEGLKGKIKEIKAFEWGTNNSPEKHDKGFTHCFILTFANEADRNIYLDHPDHKAFGKIVGPVLGDVFVVDYWAKD